MSLNVENLVRSAVILVVGLPVSLGVASSSFKDTTSADSRAVSDLKVTLTRDCLNFGISKPDSKLERDAQDSIDERLGADGADYKALCNWVL